MDKRSASIDPNTVLVVGALGVAGWGAWQIYRAFVPPDDEGQGGGGNTDPRVDPSLPPPTMTVNASRILADRIYAAIYGDGSFWDGGLTENEEEVIAAMIVPRNENDVLQLIDAYGERGGSLFTVGTYTLPAALVHYLSVSDRARINTVYARAGINLRV